MDFDQALEIANQAMFARFGKRLSDVEMAIFRGAWQDQTYEQIAANSGYSISYLRRDVGTKLWKRLGEALGEPVSKTNFQAALERRGRGKREKAEGRGQRAEGESGSRGQEPEGGSQESELTQNLKLKTQNSSPPLPTPYTDWGEAIDIALFYGRSQELAILHQWIHHDRCHLIGILGMGGIGKSSLAAKIAREIVSSPTPHSPLPTPFTHVIWRSLRNAPPLETLLAELIPFLSSQQDAQTKPERLLHWLRTHRCLLVLDNVETIMQAGDRAGHYQSEYENYGDLFRLLGESFHQSCIILTSREKPAEVGMLESDDGRVRSLHLKGSREASLALIESKRLFGTDAEKQQLCEFYSCSPLALKIVASSIQSLFDGEISAFLKEETLVFNSMRRLLDQQFERLTYLEHTIMCWLAINREWTTISELAEDIVPTVSRASLLESLESLSWRNLIERKSGSYTQQPVVMEYVTNQLIEKIATEIITLKLVGYDRHSLLKTTVVDYIRESQSRLILHPLVERLRAQFRNDEALEHHLQLVVQKIYHVKTSFFGYAIGNTLNLYRHLQTDLTGYDFSNFKIRQAYLQGAMLQWVNFGGSNFKQCIFSQPCNEIYAIAFSPNGSLFATGEADSQIRIWQTADGQLLRTLKGHANSIRAVNFSPDGALLASGSADQTIRLWETNTGQCLKTLEGHTNQVLSVAWNPNGKTLASGSSDRTIRLWDLHTGQCFNSIKGHTNWVFSVDWSPDGRVLASGSVDQTIRIWDGETGSLLNILEGHTSCVNSVCFHSDGRILASGSADQTIRIWDGETGSLLNTLEGSSEGINSVHFSPDGRLLATGGADQMVRLWDMSTQRVLKTLHGHSCIVFAVRFSPDSNLLASGSEDHTVKLWDVATGQTLRTLRGTTGWLYAAQFSPDGRLLASGGDDRIIRLWDGQTKQLLAALTGHTLWLRSVQFDPTGKWLASGSADQTVILWDVQAQRSLKVLRGHTDEVRSVCFSPDGTLLASGSQDQTIRLWEIQTGNVVQIFQGHRGWIRSVHFSPDGTQLASGSDDHTVNVWDVKTGHLVIPLSGHSNWVRAVRFSPDGRLLASSSDDQTIRIWDVKTGNTLKILQGQTNWTRSISFSADGTLLASGGMDQTIRVWNLQTGEEVGKFEGHLLGVLSVAFSPDDQILVSSSADETIRFWEVRTGACLHVLRSDRPYEGMNITGITGITEAQKMTLKALGAIED
ncbi:NACHT domain-containing protein [Kovacikia minuta CCNUW1]|uniref:WD40 domain-containing protein n=1 Tax=Kovacikia minuta TaxID=2931930 RepID=UPI001CCA4E8F|nr:NACHT domain-containing protein [Kovacikia minuta]UBF25774.1 NACHT domain-containing protein [Kovacikia minuta CCNUW1]